MLSVLLMMTALLKSSSEGDASGSEENKYSFQSITQMGGDTHSELERLTSAQDALTLAHSVSQ